MKHHSTISSGGFPAFFFFGLFLFSLDAAAATKYVSNTGNNGNSGNSLAQAWLTLQYAAEHLNAGDTLWIANGTYAGFHMETSGTAANPIVFIAIGNNATINTENPVTDDGINIEGADYIELNGMRVINQPRNGIRLVNAHNCIVRNTYCDNNFERGIFTGFTDDILLEYNECLNSIDEHGIYVSNSSDRSIIRYNTCHHNNRGGIQINADDSQGGDGISTDPQIYGNILYQNGAAGGAAINLDGVQGAFIYNNLLYENHATGIALFQQDGAEPSINALIVHNTIINASDARWCILAVNGSYGARIYNNILINQHAWRGSIAVASDALTDFDSDYNIVVNSLSNNGDGVTMTLAQWQAAGYDLNSMLADPPGQIFVAPASGNYELLTDAQAVNAGNSDLAFGVNVDINGISRPQGSEHDLGAYEAESSLAIDETEDTSEVRIALEGLQLSGKQIAWSPIQDAHLMVINLEGKVLFDVSMDGSGELSLRHLIPGIYFISIYDRRGILWTSTWTP